MANILVLEPDTSAQNIMSRFFNDSEYKLILCRDAQSAIEMASEKRVDLVVVEMALPGHSGFEFLYEFRSYADWVDIPIIVFSRIKLTEDVVGSRSWDFMRIAKSLYKPESSLAELKAEVIRVLAGKHEK